MADRRGQRLGEDPADLSLAWLDHSHQGLDLSTCGLNPKSARQTAAALLEVSSVHADQPEQKSQSCGLVLQRVVAEPVSAKVDCLVAAPAACHHHYY